MHSSYHYIYGPDAESALGSARPFAFPTSARRGCENMTPRRWLGRFPLSAELRRHCCPCPRRPNAPSHDEKEQDAPVGCREPKVVGATAPERPRRAITITGKQKWCIIIYCLLPCSLLIFVMSFSTSHLHGHCPCPLPFFPCCNSVTVNFQVPPVLMEAGARVAFCFCLRDLHSGAHALTR